MDVTIVPGQQVTPSISSVQVQVTFNNSNSFDIWYKSVRRTITIEGRVSGDEQEAVSASVPAHIEDQRVTDLPIRFQPPISVARNLNGTIDFLICYGREQGKLTKNFRMKGLLIFPRKIDGLPHIPDFIPADAEPGSFGYGEGCPN